MQGLVKDIFELDRCWMRGNENNRWLFAAMGLTVQMHQIQAFKQGRSTWNVKRTGLGVDSPTPGLLRRIEFFGKGIIKKDNYQKFWLMQRGYTIIVSNSNQGMSDGDWEIEDRKCRSFFVNQRRSIIYGESKTVQCKSWIFTNAPKAPPCWMGKAERAHLFNMEGNVYSIIPLHFILNLR